MQKFPQKKLLKIILITLCVIFAAFFIFIFIFKSFFSYHILEAKISDYTGVKFEFINPCTNFDYKFNLNFKADSINIYSNDKKTNFINIENAKISFKPLGLIFKKAYFKNIDAGNFTINISSDENGEIDLIKSFKKRNPDFILNNKIKITRLDSKIDNFTINYSDNYKTKSSILMNMKNSNVSISKRNKSLNISQKGTIKTKIGSLSNMSDFSLNISSKYPVNNFNSQDLALDINLVNINLYIFKNAAKNYISKDIDSLLGYADLKIQTEKIENNENIQKIYLKINNPTIKTTDNQILSPYKDGVNFIANFSVDKSILEIKEAKLISNELYITFFGTIKKLFSKSPETDLKIKIANTQANNFFYFLPDNLIFYRPKGIPALKKSNLRGILNGEIDLKYSPLDIGGHLKISNVHIPELPEPYIKNDVNLMFQKDKMRVYTRVYTPENEYVIIDGISNLDKSLYGKYSIKSTKKINLKFAAAYLVPIQQIIGFNIGPIPIMELDGFGNIDIKTRGTLYDAQIFGEFNANSASAKIEGLNAILKDGNCRFIFDNRNLIFKEIRGNLDGADFLLTGTGDTKGNVLLESKIKNAKTSRILKIFNNSIISKPYTRLTKDIAALSGDMEADITLKGTIKDFEDKSFFEQLSPSGTIILKNNKIILNNKLNIDKINAILNFGSKQDGSAEFNLGNSKFALNFSSQANIDKISKNQEFEIKTSLFSNKIEFLDIINFIKDGTFVNDELKKILDDIKNNNFYSKINVKSSGKISLNNIGLKNFKSNGYILGLNSKENNVQFNSGLIKIEGDKLIFDNFDCDILDGKIKVKGSVNDFLQGRPGGNSTLYLENINFEKAIKLNSNLKQLPLKIKSGTVIFKGNTLKFNAVNMDYNSAPLFVNAYLKDIYSKRIAEADFSTVINEKSCDSLINPYLTYPVKIKGETLLKGTFKGDSENYVIDLNATIPADSDISFSGANLGDINHKREIKGKIDVRKNSANIQSLKLIKYIENQNGKINPITALYSSGQIEEKENKLFLNNLKIATNSIMNVRILNLIFKKSILKKGNFECNLNLNGYLDSLKINGKINFSDLDIPLYNTQINDIKVNISNNFIDGEILAKNKESDLNIKLKAQNKLISPYIIENINISSNKLDIADILDNLAAQNPKADISKKSDFQIKSEDITVKKGSFDFKEVIWDKINAQNLKGNFSYNDNIFKLDDIILDIAKGTIKGEGRYSLKSTKLDLSAKAKDCDSNILTRDFLKLQDQIFGKMDGIIKLSAKNLNSPKGIKTLESDIDFSINDGKMPKLGSLEYLLRAGNIIKNGITGLSLNNIIEVLTPYKTGEFEKISGSLHISQGEVEKLEIQSKGKNLSLYLEGNYSILENFADIKIYGKLSQNISNALGALGNASINQFINAIVQKKNKAEKNSEDTDKLEKIPSIENENQPRYFRVKVLGDINKENYIKSFNWD